MLVAALTGNIAAGKSTVAVALSSYGATIVDADAAARAAVAPGTPALAQILATFGTHLLRPTGDLDRSALGAIVFANPDARHTLERIVHPAVEAERGRALALAKDAGATIVICDIPLLFEAQLAWQFRRIVLVDAPASQREARLVSLRQMTPRDAAARVRSQMPSALKRPRVDLILENDASPDALNTQVAAAWRRLCGWRTMTLAAHSGEPVADHGSQG